MELEELINNTANIHSNKYLFVRDYFMHLSKHYSLEDTKEMYERIKYRYGLERLQYTQKVYIDMLSNYQG